MADDSSLKNGYLMIAETHLKEFCINQSSFNESVIYFCEPHKYISSRVFCFAALHYLYLTLLFLKGIHETNKNNACFKF